MLRRGARLLRSFSLETHFTALQAKLKSNCSHEDLYQITEACFSDPSILTSDPRAILAYKDTIQEVQQKFGNHSKQLVSGIVQPLLTRMSVLPDLSLDDAMVLLRLSLGTQQLSESKQVKPALKTVLRLLKHREQPVEEKMILELYKVMHATRVLSYDLVFELESSQLFQSHCNLFAGGHGLLQIYADFNLSLDRVRDLVKKALIQEVPSSTNQQAISLAKALASAEAFDIELWRDLMFPRLSALQLHHLSIEEMTDLALVVTVLELLAPSDLLKCDYFASASYKSLRTQALYSARRSKEALKFPRVEFSPPTLEEDRAGKKQSLAHSNARFPNLLTEDIVKVLKTLRIEFSVNCLLGHPYALPAEILLPPDLVVKPLTHADFVYDSFQVMGATKLKMKLLRKLKFHVAEINATDWEMMPRKTAPGNLLRLIQLAEEKSAKS